MKTVHLKITGKVQGVFFRTTARDTAKKFRLSGWIKNNDRDEVEALITGLEKNIDDFITWSKCGPEKAEVKNVTVTEKELCSFDSFEVIR
ncbi:MAG: acylphosphatase [Ginsengibacter sp.]